MSSFKEIVTKAVIGKGKKKFTTNSSIKPEIKPSTILGCWIINHNFKGYSLNNSIVIEGSYDVNIWYSCENDTKTQVITNKENYKEIVSIPTKKNSVDLEEDVIIRSLNQPTCIKTEIDGDNIKYTIEKELGIEIVGDTKVKITIDEDEDPWEELEDETQINEAEKQIDNSVKEEFLN